MQSGYSAQSSEALQRGGAGSLQPNQASLQPTGQLDSSDAISQHSMPLESSSNQLVESSRTIEPSAPSASTTEISLAPFLWSLLVVFVLILGVVVASVRASNRAQQIALADADIEPKKPATTRRSARKTRKKSTKATRAKKSRQN